MSFKMVLIGRMAEPEWAERIAEAVPGARVRWHAEPGEAIEDIEDADAACGTVPPELLARAKQLRWIATTRAGLGRDFFYDELVESDVVVTNTPGIYNEHLAAHAFGFLMAFARRFDHYLFYQHEGSWSRDRPMINLPSSTALIVGVGGSGGELARLCAAAHLRVLGCDARVSTPPEGMDEIFAPEELDDRLGEADFVILTVPETPETRGMFNAARFARMKPGSHFVNIGRGVCVVTDDLVEALRSEQIAGAGLDVVDPEPLPPDHPLWTMPGVMITPHVAVHGSPQQQERRLEMLLDNCRRFAAGEALRHVVDKRAWF